MNQLYRYRFDLIVTSITDFTFGFRRDCRFVALQFLHTYQKERRRLPSEIVGVHDMVYDKCEMVHYFTNVKWSLVDPIAIFVCSTYPDIVVCSKPNSERPGFYKLYLMKISAPSEFQPRIDHKVYMLRSHWDKFHTTSTHLLLLTEYSTLSGILNNTDTIYFRFLRWFHHLRWLFLWFREYAAKNAKPHPLLAPRDVQTVICSFL
jgi:hypothetical protein